MECLFDPDRAYFATRVWIYDIDHPWKAPMETARPTQPEAGSLYYAALCGLRSLMEFLTTTHSTDVNARGGIYGTPSNAALVNEEVDIALVLLQNGADINTLDRLRWGPLHRAAVMGHRAVLEFLLEHHADVNFQICDERVTPLHLAMHSVKLDVCRLLLKHGVDVSSRTRYGLTSLHLASRN